MASSQPSGIKQLSSHSGGMTGYPIVDAGKFAPNGVYVGLGTGA
ncbi:FAD-binding domain-containing protein [Legionella brunensis]|nr:FAD-binding domain-containing protein [Legionella brunensis]